MDETSEEPPNPISSAFTMTVRVMLAGRASLLVRRDSAEVLTIAEAVAISPSDIESIEVVDGQGIAGIVAERAVSLFGHPLRQSPRYSDDHTFISTPVIGKDGRVVAVLNLTERQGGRRYGGEHLGAGEAIAELIGDLLKYQDHAQRDQLTGLLNRAAVVDEIRREIAMNEASGDRRQGIQRPFLVVFVDADGLHETNKRFGYAKGDELLRAVSGAIQSVARPYDYVGRWGGDEFLALLTDVHSVDEDALKRRIRQGLTTEGVRVGLPDLSASIGIAPYPEDGNRAEVLIEVAQERMQGDKRACGGGRDS
ncbi:MAG TPA: sensor domain-containing diguanylate cyclase [Chloroflexota bacterium]|nr:sensor domain-containing diguanylate cyclase [Chloroflexota bacterium]